MQLTVTLPKPHEKQAAIKDHPAKRHVICAGRRGGKTTLAALVACERMLQGRRVLLASPTQWQADAFWEKCREWLSELITAGIVRKNESTRVMEMSNGGRIRAKTAWNADTLRGDHADFLVLDEFAQMSPDAWDMVGAPMLLDNDGDAWFISTPLRRNHFYKMYQKAIQDTSGRWASWHFTSYDNPHLSTDALAELKQDMGEEAIRQEILAEFLESDGQVFRNIPACIKAPLDVKPNKDSKDRIVGGLDWGKHRDFSVLSVFNATTKTELFMDRFNKIDYIFQRDRILADCVTWGVTDLWVEINSIGEPNFEMLVREAPKGLRLFAFETTPSSKPPLIESLALAFERTEAQWLNLPIATSELESYERKVSQITGRSQYSAPEGLHDDTVMARAIVWHGTLQGPSVARVYTDNPFFT